MKVAIDIGHARNTGAVCNGLEEHAVVSVIGRELEKLLAGKGHVVDVLDFPELSNKADLNATIKAANAGGYDIGISLHCDSASRYMVERNPDGEEKCVVEHNPNPHGAHVCYYPGSVRGKRLAVCISGHLVKLLPGRSDKVQERPYLAILRQTRCPWVLCECGFITNPENADMMKKHPERIAEAIAEGVESYS